MKNTFFLPLMPFLPTSSRCHSCHHQKAILVNVVNVIVFNHHCWCIAIVAVEIKLKNSLVISLYCCEK